MNDDVCVCVCLRYRRHDESKTHYLQEALSRQICESVNHYSQVPASLNLYFCQRCVSALCHYVFVLLCVMSQVGVYMGKRDFVDHCDFVDPVGEFSEQSRFSTHHTSPTITIITHNPLLHREEHGTSRRSQRVFLITFWYSLSHFSLIRWCGVDRPTAGKRKER